MRAILFPMKTLFLIVSGFALITGQTRADDKSEATAVVNSFYASYVAAMTKQENGEKVVPKSPQLSPGFKKAYAALMAKAWKENPESGLGYDPIVCGQDFPDAGYAVTGITIVDHSRGVAEVSSKDKNFKQTISVMLVKLDGKWLINGIDKLKAP